MDAISNRRQLDRRSPPAFFTKYHFIRSGRRAAPRRNHDNVSYADHYSISVIFVAIGIVCMSVLDATFTLKLLTLGAIELNSVMAMLIEHDVTKFVGYKLGLTIFSVLLLVIHQDVRLSIGIRVNRVAQFVFALYVALIIYELSLFRIILA